MSERERERERERRERKRERREKKENIVHLVALNAFLVLHSTKNNSLGFIQMSNIKED